VATPLREPRRATGMVKNQFGRAADLSHAVVMGANAISRDLSRMIGGAQVAAVCYRRSANRLQFLLVRTDKGRWSFPKGHVERALTSSQAAAQEALEEAGALGIIAPRPFARYRHKKRALPADVLVRAYLLHVVRTIDPPETHRRPTWFDAHEARTKLAASRKPKYRKELRVVLDRAVHLLNGRHPGPQRCLP